MNLSPFFAPVFRRHRVKISSRIRADLHGTIFVSCDKLTTGLRHDLRLVCTSEKCRSILKHVLKRCGNRKSCRRPAVSLSHATKIVPCKSALTILPLGSWDRRRASYKSTSVPLLNKFLANLFRIARTQYAMPNQKLEIQNTNVQNSSPCFVKYLCPYRPIWLLV